MDKNNDKFETLCYKVKSVNKKIDDNQSVIDETVYNDTQAVELAKKFEKIGYEMIIIKHSILTDWRDK